MKYGAPDAVYFDNGKQYRTNWMQRACGKLGIRLLYCRPYAASSKGKIEKYNQTVDSFLREAMLAKPKTIDELNNLYDVWMEECYLHREHSALDKKTPHEAYYGDSKELKMIPSKEIAGAFLSCEKRKVDKSGCINFEGMKYEVEMGLHMIGKTVDVVFDAADISKITIECEGLEPCHAIPLKIQSHSGTKPSLPEKLTKKEAEDSRLLNAALTVNKERKKVHKTALSFKGILNTDKVGGNNV